MQWWKERFGNRQVRQREIVERDGRLTLDFEDPEGQRFSLIDDGASGEAHPWEKSPVPTEHQIRGLGPITLSIPNLERTGRILQELLNMRPARDYEGNGRSTVHVYEMGPGGPSAELHVAVDPNFHRPGRELAACIMSPCAQLSATTTDG